MKTSWICLLIALSAAPAFAKAPPVLADEWSTFPLYASVGYDQPLRPQFHFTSRMGWLNDPNGMVYYDGEWHMCFQHFAKGNASGPKSWGHAVSTDLVHWTQLPHAINPYPNVKWDKGANHAIWSGSAVVDELNALGKQTNEVKTLFAIYTATHAGEDKKAAFFQAGAYSTDKGRTWTKINGGRPIIDHLEGFDPGQRDPYVFFHEPTKSYVLIMEIGGPNHAVRLWRSTDLMNWQVLQDIPNKSAECIGMFSVPLDGNPNNKKWVITNAGTGYEVGDFDGTKWTGLGDKDKDGRPLRFESGDCYYAAQVFNQAPDHRVVHVGWLRSAAAGYSPFTEAGMPFTQQLSIPAEITLRTTPDGIRMVRNPVREIELLYARTDKFENIPAKELNTKLAALSPELIDMSVEFAPAGNFTLNVRGLKINFADTKHEFNFTNAARVAGEKAGLLTLPVAKQHPYRDTGFRAIPAPAVNGKVKLRVLVDRASLELFVNDGQAAASFVVVPKPDNRIILIEGNDGQKFNAMTVHELKSAWQKSKRFRHRGKN
jgi:sucrose-6-phosphate hydrolase SacC (GH32 family)